MRLTASSLPRAAVCPGSALLPQADTQNDHADAGTESHAALEAAATQGRLEDLPEEVRALIPVGAMVAAEVAVAYSMRTDTARILGLGINRAYEVTDDEIAGTIDLQIVVDGTRATVIDYKRHEDVGLPDANEQTLFYGLATARLYGLPEVTLVVAYVKQDDDGSVTLLRPLVSRVIDELDLDAFAARLRWIAERVREQAARPIPDVRESKHCRWCSAAAHCPAKSALIRRLVSGSESDELEMLMPLNEETAALAWERVGHAQNLLKRITRALYAFAKERPFKLANGHIVGPYEKVGNETLNGDVVHEVVAERHGKEVADKAVVYHATKARLESALKAAGVPTPTRAKEQILAEVRRRGGAKQKREPDVGEHEPTPKLTSGE